MTFPRANHLRLVPEGRQHAPRVFRSHLHALAIHLAAEPECPTDAPYVTTARALLHCAGLTGWGRVRMIRQLERQLAAELFKALPPTDPLELLGGKA